MALVNAFKSNSVPLDKLNENSKQTYVSRAFDVAEKQLKVAPTIGALQLCDRPDGHLCQRYIQRFKDMEEGVKFKDESQDVFTSHSGKIGEGMRREPDPVGQAARKAISCNDSGLYLARDHGPVHLDDKMLTVLRDVDSSASGFSKETAKDYGMNEADIHPGCLEAPEVEWEVRSKLITSICSCIVSFTTVHCVLYS